MTQKGQFFCFEKCRLPLVEKNVTSNWLAGYNNSFKLNKNAQKLSYRYTILYDNYDLVLDKKMFNLFTGPENYSVNRKETPFAGLHFTFAT